MSFSKVPTKKESPEQAILVDTTRAARLLAICPRKLWQMTKDRQIPALKIGKSVRYRVADLDAWTQRQAQLFGNDGDAANTN